MGILVPISVDSLIMTLFRGFWGSKYTHSPKSRGNVWDSARTRVGTGVTE